MTDRDLNLMVGACLKLEKEATGKSYYVELLGYSIGRGVIVSTPQEQEVRPAVVAGDEVVVRYLGADRNYAFRSRVLLVATEPYAHAHLEYPGGVQATMARRAVRVPVTKPNALRLTVRDEGRQVTVTMQNISLGGARLVAPVRLGGRGDRFAIELPTLPADLDQALSIGCVVRHVSEQHDGDDIIFAHGIEFLNLDQQVRDFIRRFIACVD